MSVIEAVPTLLRVEDGVEKERTLYLWENVRIHLDRVAGLHQLLEIEALRLVELVPEPVAPPPIAALSDRATARLRYGTLLASHRRA